MLANGVVLLVVLALVALGVCGAPLWMKLAIGVCALAYAIDCRARFMRLPAIKLSWYEAGHWRVSGLHDHETIAELQHATVRAGWIVLTLRCSDTKRLRLLLTPDVCDAETRRRLRVRLARSQDAQTGAQAIP